MVGIASYGSYVPILRISHAEIAQAWGGSAGQGEKAVANFDEDGITMAVEAATDCLLGLNRQKIDALYFASTTPPYSEKQCAALIATVLDLENHVITADFTGSTRAGTIAMKAAIDAVKSGSAKQVMVVTADCREGVPQTEWEKNCGDGASAVLITGDDLVCFSIEDANVSSDEFTFNWRRSEDHFVQTWEDRFIMTEGYQASMQQAIAEAMKSGGLKPGDFAGVALYGPNQRQQSALAKLLGFDPKTQLRGSGLLESVGNAGAAGAIMMLTAALDEAKTGDLMLLANFGDGADAFVIKAIKPAKNNSDLRGLKKFLSPKIMMSSYHSYLQFRNLLNVPPKSSAPGSLTAIWRERKSTYGCYGVKCRVCGTLQYPIQRVCCECQTKDDFDEVRLAERTGKLITFTKEMGQGIEFPKVWAVVEIEGGCRYFTILTDVAADDLDMDDIGLTVEMTFRRLSQGSGFHNYLWKCRPLRGGKE